MTVRELSEHINVSAFFIYRLVEEKRISHIRVGKKILFDLRKIEEFILDNTVDAVDWNEKLKLKM